MTVTVTLPDGGSSRWRTAPRGPTPRRRSGPGLAKAALAVEVSHPEAGGGSVVRDLARPLPDGARMSILTATSGEEALALISHDAAHVLATAVMELYEA